MVRIFEIQSPEFVVSVLHNNGFKAQNLSTFTCLRELLMAAKEEKNINVYSVLGVKKECSSTELRAAYKKLALKWHPDRCASSGDSEEAKKKFQAIQEAYSVLSNANKRFMYDIGVYENDDDENDEMGDFLGEMAELMTQTKPNSRGQIRISKFLVHSRTRMNGDLLAMNGGDNRYSYVKNSNLQKSGFNATKGILKEAILEKLDIQKLHNNTKTFTIADFGCSVGPNAFYAVQSIIDAVDQKYKSEGLLSQIQEYQVCFSDNIINDFNTLFQSLPSERNYYAVGVPGSFYTRLFPKGSLQFVHSSFAIHWLSKVPQEIVDINSPAWNKGRINFENAHEDVLKAYSAQHVRDLETFLHVRAEEIVVGGLVALVFPVIPTGSSSKTREGYYHLDLLGSSLMDMANMGIVSEAAVDSFNLPVYISSSHEVEAAVKTNGCFNIEKMEELCPAPGETAVVNNAQTYAMHLRAALEGIIKEQFGNDVIDELFDRFSKKLEDSLSISKLETYSKLFVLLKRK